MLSTTCMLQDQPIERYLNYSTYSFYRMGITTIQVTNETKEKIASFGNKGESYDTIIRRLYEAAIKTQLRDFLMSSEDNISLDDFEKEIDEKWPESK